METLVVDGAIFGLQKSGGISRMWAEILLELEKDFALHHLVYLLLPRNRNVEWERISTSLKNIKIVKRKRFRWGKRSYFMESLYLSKIAFQLRSTLWHSSFFVGFPLWRCKQKISWLYDMIPEKLMCASLYETKMKFKTLKDSSHILTISHSSEKDLKELWPEFTSKARTVYISSSEMHVSQEAPDSYFVYLGTRKGYKNFLPAVKELFQSTQFSSYRLLVLGGEEEWSQEENEVFTSLKIKDRIDLVGTLPLNQLQKIIASCSAILFPSLYEGFGLPILEAFLMGIPVLACRTSSIPEITGEEYPLADPTSPSTYSEVLLRLLEEREKWIAYGKKRSELFSREKMMEGILKAYNIGKQEHAL